MSHSLSVSPEEHTDARAPARVLPGADDKLLEPALGYGLAAGAYDDWHWQRFWCWNETPFVAAVLASLPIGVALDVGTGTGRYAGILRGLGHEVHGIDVSGRMLERASAYLGSSKGLAVADLRAAPFPTSSFDLLTCCRVLSHVEDVDAAFVEFRRLLRPRGRIVITDVDSRHDYVATRIPVSGRNIFIKVHKHSVQDLAKSALATGLRVITRRSFVAKELPWHPPPEVFPAIDWEGKRPVFSLLVLESRAS
jgi:SAM-dependent methyltransferase